MVSAISNYKGWMEDTVWKDRWRAPQPQQHCWYYYPGCTARKQQHSPWREIIKIYKNSAFWSFFTIPLLNLTNIYQRKAVNSSQLVPLEEEGLQVGFIIIITIIIIIVIDIIIVIIITTMSYLLSYINQFLPTVKHSQYWFDFVGTETSCFESSVWDRWNAQWEDETCLNGISCC